MKVLKVVLTGGPCGGKTTSIQSIEQEFSEKGYKVLIVPEAATILINSGIRPFGEDALSMYEFQKYVINMQCYLEDVAEMCAATSKNKTIILCDRGLLDDRAYVSEKDFNSLLAEFKFDLMELMNRYDLVLHLKTVADGKEELYTLSNNGARTESAEEAREKDQKTLNAWLGHNNLKILGNETTFEEKINLGIKEIYRMIKMPYPIQSQEKYLVNEIDFDLFDNVDYEKFNLEQYYIFDGVEEICFRKMMRDGEVKYYEIKKIDTDLSKERLVKRRCIDEGEYLSRIPEGTTPIRKERYSFAYKNQYFRLDVFEDGLKILEIEDVEFNKDREIPSFIKVSSNVSFDSYKNSKIFEEINSNKKQLYKK